MTHASLAPLLRLVSPTLPVGAYSYSQGLEWVIESGMVRDEATGLAWILDGLEKVVSRFEAPVALRLYRAWAAHNLESIQYWNERFLAGRETAELYAETAQMGYSLKRLLMELGFQRIDAKAAFDSLDPCSFPAAFSFAAVDANIDEQDMLLGFLWAWSENQVMAALKAVPLGQVAGQRMLCALIARLPQLVREIVALKDEEISNFTPGFAIASALHETQYSRLFRS